MGLCPVWTPKGKTRCKNRAPHCGKPCHRSERSAQQISQCTLFRGYRALTVAATGLMAIAAAVVQPVVIPAPEHDLAGYLALWITVAAISLTLVAVQLAGDYLATHSEFARRGILQAAEQFAPCVLAGGLLTVFLARFVPSAAALLPGLWAILFSLGVFASWRRLPRACLFVGHFYLLAGVALIALAGDDTALSPYGMGITFGVGQLATAAALYFAFERKHGS